MGGDPQLTFGGLSHEENIRGCPGKYPAGICSGEIFREGVIFHGRNVRGDCPGWVSRSTCRITSFMRAEVMICGRLVNTHTDTHTDSFRLVIYYYLSPLS